MSAAPFARSILPGYCLVPSPYPASHAQISAAFHFVPLDSAATAVPAAYAPLQAPQFTSPFRLKILHINDLHGQLARLAAHGRTSVFSRIVRRLRLLREEARDDPQRGVLFLSAGDEVGGSLFDGLENGRAAHAIYRAYSAAGLDAAVPGNHDFDAGPAALAAALQQEARFPLLAANVRAPAYLVNALSPAAILVIKGVRVGLIGVTTPARKNGHALHISDPRAAVQQVSAALRPWCDVLILLSHLGLELGAETAGVAGAGDVEVARSLPPGALQAVIGGHTHLALNEEGLSSANVVNGIPLLQAGMFGRFLGEATIKLNGRAALSSARLQRTADLPPDAAFEAGVIAPLLDGLEDDLQRPLGRVAGHADFATEALFNDFAAGESAFANFVTDALVARLRQRGLGVDLALLDAPALHDGLVPGEPLALADWLRVMPYADTVRLLRLSGRQLWRLLQDNARRIDLAHEPHVERGFLHFSAALRYTVRLAERRAALRAGGICVAGAPLHAQWNRSFVVALSSFVRVKARSWEGRAGTRLALDGGALPLGQAQDTGLFLREEVLAAIRAAQGVHGARDGRLRIVSPPGTAVRLAAPALSAP